MIGIIRLTSGQAHAPRSHVPVTCQPFLSLSFAWNRVRSSQFAVESLLWEWSGVGTRQRQRLVALLLQSIHRDSNYTSHHITLHYSKTHSYTLLILHYTPLYYCRYNILHLDIYFIKKHHV